MKRKLPILLLVAALVIMSVIPVNAAEHVDVGDPTVTASQSITPDDENIMPLEDDIDLPGAEDEIPVLDAENSDSDEEVTLNAASQVVGVNDSPVAEEVADVTSITSLSEIKGSGKYALANNIVNEFVTINASWDVTFDFNGFYISVNTGRPFTNNGTLTLVAPNGGGVNNAPGTGFGTVTNNAGALVTVNGGTFTSNNDGSAIRNVGGTAVINGGTFNDVRAIANMGVATINGGTFNQISNLQAYIIFSNGISTTINNAVVNGNFGGVAHNKGHLEINNGTFSANTFYALYINKESSGGPFTAEINGGSFTSTNSYGLLVNVSETDSYMVNINGGNFSGSSGAAYILGKAAAEGGYATPVISGGTFIGTDVNPFVHSSREQNLDNTSNEWTVVARSYAANIVDGNFTSEAGRFIPNEAVAIIAKAPAKGMIFDKWISEEVQFENEKSPTTTFYMPEKEVTVLATYIEAPAKEIPAKASFETVFRDTKGPLTAEIEKPAGSFLYITIKVKNMPTSMMSLFSTNDDSYIEIFVDPSQYTISEDGTTITLHEDFLQTLGGGEYVVSVVFSGGIARLPLAISEDDAPPIIDSEEKTEEKAEEKPETPTNSNEEKENAQNSTKETTKDKGATQGKISENLEVLGSVGSASPLQESSDTEITNDIETLSSEESNDSTIDSTQTDSPASEENERMPFSPLAGLIAAAMSSLGFTIGKFVRRK